MPEQDIANITNDLITKLQDQSTRKNLATEFDAYINFYKEEYNNVYEYMEKFLEAYKIYEKELKTDKGSVNRQVAILEHYKSNLTELFKKIQNIFAAIRGQIFIETFVEIDSETGYRTVKIAENSIELLQAVKSKNRNGKYTKLSYQFNQLDKIYTANLSNVQLSLLQQTAKEITERYFNNPIKELNTHLILWKYRQKWYGITTSNQGAINEAFAAFYLNEYNKWTGKDVPKQNEPDISTYILHKQYGMRSVDNSYGFYIGDQQINNINFMIKGKGGGLEAYKTAKELFEKLVSEQKLTEKEMAKLLNDLTQTNLNKATPIIHELVSGTIQDIQNQIGDAIDTKKATEEKKEAKKWQK